MLFYMIFGTNLLTGGPTHIAVLLPVSVFQRKKYQTESKRNETFGSVIFWKNMILETWSSRQKILKEATRVPPLLGVPPCLVGPSSTP